MRRKTTIDPQSSCVTDSDSVLNGKRKPTQGQSRKLSTWTHRLSLLALLLAAALALAGALGCSATTTDEDVSSNLDNLIIIDVRTPAEYAEGHLEGAINIDISATNFESKISELDPDGSYLVYCRTGVRAGTALETMQKLGFSDVTNGRGLQDAANSTGLAIVK